MKILKSRNSVNILYFTIFFLFVGYFSLQEWSWRFVSPFEVRVARILNGNGRDIPVIIEQYSKTPVDTVRNEFRDPQQGVTLVRMHAIGSSDSLNFVAKGHYYSTLAPISFSSDHARELLLIPNTEQGLSLGVGELVYLDTLDHLHIAHLESSNIGDVDTDGVYEIFDKQLGAFEHLDRASGRWEPIPTGRRPQ